MLHTDTATLLEPLPREGALVALPDGTALRVQVADRRAGRTWWYRIGPRGVVARGRSAEG